jgi:hypothetical protein
MPAPAMVLVARPGLFNIDTARDEEQVESQFPPRQLQFGTKVKFRNSRTHMRRLPQNLSGWLHDFMGYTASDVHRFRAWVVITGARA